ncbi:hypothetical protein EV361DRAFT_919770 [Lentinula raphanica]|uniref:Uncharacterized protein n=1 Tax=Lentinula raphanica TaxID=153919 RepID=A0AA38P5L5_9AGAR|nr:hypothetical protein C8R42DRAFT_728573 [Lentinula raphanica]KAJ3753971.1 hypothetical protein EV360DRAFT_87280 [Lentinula raphanica]KAJ3772633.1 hypothetical protein FB446DRAFT_845428 [Lentinula raphanica]KAJ3827041.1 hypothetical protein F5880DRAFT_1309252 [Lentinula raphanica]KAJ3836748.1 hypothetical protein F5878DRAFT_247758 [Lentinula raphanica]
MTPSRAQVARQGWGNRLNFQLSHGLRMTPDDIEEGNLILDGYIRYGVYNADSNANDSQNGGKAQGGSGGSTTKSGASGKSGGRS